MKRFLLLLFVALSSFADQDIRPIQYDKDTLLIKLYADSLTEAWAHANGLALLTDLGGSGIASIVMHGTNVVTPSSSLSGTTAHLYIPTNWLAKTTADGLYDPLGYAAGVSNLLSTLRDDHMSVSGRVTDVEAITNALGAGAFIGRHDTNGYLRAPNLTDGSLSVAFGQYADAAGDGVAIGLGANGATEGTALGQYAAALGYGVAVGASSSGTNNGTAVGRMAVANGVGNVAIGGDDSGTNSAYVPDGMTDTVEIGRGTAISNGFLHYRGHPIVDPNGVVVGASPYDDSWTNTISARESDPHYTTGGVTRITHEAHTNLTLALGAHGGETDPVYLSESNLYVRLSQYASDTQGLWNAIAAIPTNFFDSFRLPVDLVSEATVTVTRAKTLNTRLVLTNAATLTFNGTDWATTGVGRVAMELYTGGYSLTFDTNAIDGSGSLTLKTNQFNGLFFRKTVLTNRWEVRQ